MSKTYQSSKDVPSSVLADRLDELSMIVSSSRDRIDAEFTMRIPAECDRDADLVMAEAAQRLRAATPASTGAELKPFGWVTEDHLTDKSATTYSSDIADRWRAKGWPVTPFYLGQLPAPDEAVSLIEAALAFVDYRPCMEAHQNSAVEYVKRESDLVSAVSDYRDALEWRGEVGSNG